MADRVQGFPRLPRPSLLRADGEGPWLTGRGRRAEHAPGEGALRGAAVARLHSHRRAGRADLSGPRGPDLVGDRDLGGILARCSRRAGAVPTFPRDAATPSPAEWRQPRRAEA